MSSTLRTNWAHESMLLTFGMQYMLAGAYAYRDENHVRVDIVYNHLSEPGRRDLRYSSPLHSFSCSPEQRSLPAGVRQRCDGGWRAVVHRVGHPTLAS
ncbi:hypothetical protein MPL3356_110138 [Mesorhizobium plurifarium]|uniref:Uncharacterized protein n=1 Tax=Mesorhizobium plurifarium TaxID=69974 RepID=A0A090DEA9_MESPL|nr:hypothetical protein MPL3356_110138 [Mesorhizobium plurifarium]